jgi:hypothetical protein
MRARKRLGLSLLMLLPCFLPRAAAGELLPLAVPEGRCEAVLDTPHGDEQFYLVLGSLAPRPGPYRVTVHAEPTKRPAALPLESPPRDARWEEQVRDLAQRLARARRQRLPPEQIAPLKEPPARKVFHLFLGDQDFQNTARYVAITAELRAVGRHCQVYVDRDCPDPDALRPMVDDAVRAFDDDILPLARRRLGHALDVDRDGRFTILFSGRLAGLQNGKVSLGGFVRGSDFYRDLAAPFSNRCDMMYLNTDLRPGPHLRTLLAHEYTHAVIVSEHVFGPYLPEVARRDEDSWLNEGLAHLVEDLHGHGWSNLDYRVSAYLNAPHRYPLVVADYYRSGLWRTPGIRGAAYLFLRWCVDRHGDDLPARLVQSNLHGVLNLEVATQRPFAELFREWSAALLLTGSGLPVEGVAPLRRPGLRGPLAGRLLCGPRVTDVPLSRGDQALTLAGTSVAHLLLHSPGGARSRLSVRADGEADLQVSLIRLPRTMARLSLRCEPGPKEGTVRLLLTAHGGEVRLESAAWEKLLPAEKGLGDTSYRPQLDPLTTVRAWFGEVRLKAGQTRRSEAIALPGLGKVGIVFRVGATDEHGHHISAWAVLDPADAQR